MGKIADLLPSIECAIDTAGAVITPHQHEHLQETPKRVVRACDNCRRLKEKCNGEDPCARCIRFRRKCVFTDAFKQKRIRPSKRKAHAARFGARRDGAQVPLTPETAYDVQRVQALEEIAKHLTGIDRPDQQQLRSAISSLKESTERSLCPKISEDAKHDEGDHVMSDEPSPAGAFSQGELSHSNFSMDVQRKVRSRLREATIERSGLNNHKILPASGQLRSQDSIVLDAVSLFPPMDVASFLIDVFFEFAQTNYCYVDEDTLRQKVKDFYSSSTVPSIDDASWVATVLMVFAIGTQFAHLDKRSYGRPASPTSDDTHGTGFPDDTLALAFYRKASFLIPDIITAASFESVQAFILLGVYTLPIDPGGLSCTYFGIAIRLATQNGMHLKHQKGKNRGEIELRRRIWWTACTLERRICILHGRNVSIGRSEIDTPLPTDLPELRPRERINTFQNIIAMIRLTEMLEDARDAILKLRKAKKLQRSMAIQRITAVKRHLEEYWQTLPENVFCRDLSPGQPLFRFNVHLALTYHLVYIFIGRAFIFKDNDLEVDSEDTGWQKVRDEMVNDCLKSAVSVVDICQLLQDEVGLARSSYTEFTSCCAALLAVLAERISSETLRLKDVCTRGIALLKKMSVGIFSRNSERLAVESLEIAVLKLDNRRREASEAASGRAYMQFRHWVSLQQVGPGNTSTRPWQRNDFPLESWGSGALESDFGDSQNTHFHTDSGCPAFSLGEFASVPGLDDWFEYGLH